MTREEKLKAIYKEMANKERSIGCGINVKYRAYYHGETGGEVSYSKEDNLIVGVDGVARNGDIELSKSDLSEADPNGYIEDLETLVEIIGHPVMIGDVLDWIYNKKFNVDDPMIGLFYDPKKMDYETKLFLVQDYFFGRVNGYWRKKRKPIEEQSDECIDYVYSLMQKN